MAEKRRFWRLAGMGLLSLCVVVTLALSAFIAFNYKEINRAISVVSLIKTQSIHSPNTGQLIDGAVVGLVGSLNDPYSMYLDPKEYQILEQNITGSYGGVGLLIGVDEEKRIVVVSPFKGTPAQRVGIHAGDVIIQIDGKDTKGMNLDVAASMMKGNPGTNVNIKIARKGESELLNYTLTREQIQIPSLEGKMLADYPGIGYINMSNFSEHTGRDLGKLLDDLQKQGARGLILDLRNNPGGYLQAALEVADYFIPEGPIVYLVDKYRTIPYNADKQRIDLPLVVLVNEGSASASEIVAGAIKDTGAGVIVGEKTFGKGLVQTLFQLKGGAAVKLTTAKYLTPAKQDINKIGIGPQVEVPLAGKEEADALLNAPDATKDPQLAKGIEVLRSKLK